MRRFPRRRAAILALVLAAAIAVPLWAGAGPAISRPPAAAHAAGVDLLVRAWGWIESLFLGSSYGGDSQTSHRGNAASPAHPDAGCGGDPSGQTCNSGG
jgi:hypothetical protein